MDNPRCWKRRTVQEIGSFMIDQYYKTNLEMRSREYREFKPPEK